jgi:formiminoglutamase
MMSNLATVRSDLFDCGDVTVKSHEFEVAQLIYADKISQSINTENLAIGLGGGHEIAFGSYLGLSNSERVSKGDCIGIINLDSHFDLRPGEPSSGTPFAQALELGSGNTRYLALGISEAANGKSLFERADALGAQFVLDRDLYQAPLEKLHQALQEIDHLYVSLDLDVLPASIAPGVSAPAAKGVSLEVITQILQLTAASGKLRVFDVAELNPRYDVDNRTARTAARLIWEVVKAWKPS